MIRQAHGNLLDAEVDAVVNTVNTVGVMGKGIALQFKNAYPANFKAYRDACARGDVRVGRMFVFDAGQLVRPRWIINFPTKQHWKSRSRLTDIETGLDDLRRVLSELDIRSVAVPPLGCGNGGLDWADVRPLIDKQLGGLDVDVLIYPPDGAPHPAEMLNRTERPTLTPGKAALVEMLARYSGPAVGATLVEVQKLMYFLQEAGQELRLRYAKAQYGPYADNLRQVLKNLENHHLRGFGDGSKNVRDADPIDVLPGAAAEAASVLAGEPDIGARMDRVFQLVEGFESAYGLELLASVHWAAVHETTTADDSDERIASTILAWSSRKRAMFARPHIAAALRRLREQGWITHSVPAIGA
jgi:O-acetyl-ADP-ribose deacetylase (regulator of RNase III)